MLPGGAKSFCHKVVTRLGRAFGYGPNAWPNTEWVRGAPASQAGVLFATSYRQFS
jgi:hypothetical protein